MCVNNEDRSPARIRSRDTAPTPIGFAEIVSDDFPVLHARKTHEVFSSNAALVRFAVVALSSALSRDLRH